MAAPHALFRISQRVASSGAQYAHRNLRQPALTSRLPIFSSLVVASRRHNSNSNNVTNDESNETEPKKEITYSFVNDLDPDYKPGLENKVEEHPFDFGLITDEDLAKEQEQVKKQIEQTDLDPSLYTKEIIVRMPDIDDDQPGGKIVKWYKKEGDVVVWNDMLCDVDVEGFSFGMQNEDEEPALMGKIFHEASEDDVVKDGEPICILLHKRNEKEATSS